MWIGTLFELMKMGKNTQDLSNLQLHLGFTLYLVELKRHKTAHFEISHRSIYSCELFETFIHSLC